MFTSVLQLAVMGSLSHRYAVVQQQGVTWRCCSGRGRTAASGMLTPAVLPHKEVTWRCCSGRGRTAVRIATSLLAQQTLFLPAYNLLSKRAWRDTATVFERNFTNGAKRSFLFNLTS